MKKTVLVIAVLMAAVLLGSCGNTLFNASGVFITELTVENLPAEGEYALAGSFFEEEWTNTYLATQSVEGSVTWEFDPALEVPVGDSEFKIVQSGTWNFAVEGGFRDPHGNANVFDAEGLTIDGGEWVITFDATKTESEAMTAVKP